MTNATYQIPDAGERMPFTGERYTTGLSGNIQNEHYHRYLFALRFCEGRDVLDVASGEGYGAALLAGVARSVIGVDIHGPSVTFATQAYGRDNLSFRDGSAFALPLDDASVDVVVSFETIEHLADHVTFMSEVNRVLRPGGTFVVSTPDRRVYSEEPGYTNPFHLKELSPEEFTALLRESFPQVKLFSQEVIAGSLIAQVGEAVGEMESFRTTDGRIFEHVAGLPRPPYLVAVASSDAKPLPTVSLLHGLPTDAMMSGVAPAPPPVNDASKREKDLLAESDDLRQQLITARLEAGEARRHILELDRDRGYLRAMLTDARRLTDIARAEHVHARTVFEARTAALEAGEAAAQAKVAEVRAEMEQQGRAEAEQRDLAAKAWEAGEAVARARVAEVRAEMEQRDLAAKATMSAWTETIRTSTSWRLTGPMRVAVRFVRRAFR